ncbi:hypothetical protein [Micromonospora sp. 4G55]|uniref:hypothetical protein n=1 Tax=Micromonospora sp. 4G55 TaxID=2806102 RepID=UPI001A3E00D7|nr:hypothetical protein [Micromonospora sp. 4G55]MBM0255824.1 hypothetical protein [Micromonospora sp. 4G55]
MILLAIGALIRQSASADDAEPQPEDWNASLWDPEVQEGIERRRRRGRPISSVGHP